MSSGSPSRPLLAQSVDESQSQPHPQQPQPTTTDQGPPPMPEHPPPKPPTTHKSHHHHHSKHTHHHSKTLSVSPHSSDDEEEQASPESPQRNIGQVSLKETPTPAPAPAPAPRAVAISQPSLRSSTSPSQTVHLPSSKTPPTLLPPPALVVPGSGSSSFSATSSPVTPISAASKSLSGSLPRLGQSCGNFDEYFKHITPRTAATLSDGEDSDDDGAEFDEGPTTMVFYLCLLCIVIIAVASRINESSC